MAFCEIDLLRVLEEVPYTIPTFSVVTVRLTHVVMGVWDGDEDKVKHYDAFLHRSSNQELKAPCTIEVLESCNLEVQTLLLLYIQALVAM